MRGLDGGEHVAHARRSASSSQAIVIIAGSELESERVGNEGGEGRGACRHACNRMERNVEADVSFDCRYEDPETK